MKKIVSVAVLSMGSILSSPTNATDVDQPLDHKSHLNLNNTTQNTSLNTKTSLTGKFCNLDPIKFVWGMGTVATLGVSMYCHKKLPRTSLISAAGVVGFTSIPTLTYAVHTYMNPLKEIESKTIDSVVKVNSVVEDNIKEVEPVLPPRKIVSIPLANEDNHNIAKLLDKEIQSFYNQYPGVSHSFHNTNIGDWSDPEWITRRLDVDITDLNSLKQEQIKLDLKFLEQNRYIPHENYHCRLDNYLPENASQEKLKKVASEFLEFNGLTQSGLILSAPVGTGKTHMAIGLAKESEKKGEKVLFKRPHDIFSERGSVIDCKTYFNSNYTTFILDGFNGGTSETSFFRCVSDEVANRGGRHKIFVTTNLKQKDFLNKVFEYHPQDKQQFEDRRKDIFCSIEINGKSHRTRTPWYEQSKGE